jgi:hypothetical protein
MRYQPHEQWDERNFKFQTYDRSPNIPFGYSNEHKAHKVEIIVYSIILLSLFGAVLCVL